MAPDRSDLQLGLLTAIWSHAEGIVGWDPSFLGLALHLIVDENSPAFRAFRAIVPENRIATHVLIALGRAARSNGVAAITCPIASGNGIELLPPVERDWFKIDHVLLNPVGAPPVIVSQGPQTCPLDTTLFLSAAFEFGRMRRDALTFERMRQMTHIQVAFRFFMSLYRHGSSALAQQARTARNDKLRDVLLRVLADCVPTITYGGMNACGEIFGHCWKGLPSLSYTQQRVSYCCGRRITDEDGPVRRRTLHYISLQNTTPGRADTTVNWAPDGRTVAEAVAQRWFPYSRGNRDSNNNMGLPPPPCPHNPLDCLQLPHRMTRILDDPPRYLCVPIIPASPVAHTSRRYGDPIVVKHSVRIGEATARSQWSAVGVVFYIPSAMHFVARAYSPPGFPTFKGKVCFYDGVNGSKPVPKPNIKSLMDEVNPAWEVAMLLYRLDADL